MPAYIVTCNQVDYPLVIAAGPGKGTMDCLSGTMTVIEYQPYLFTPLTAEEGSLLSAGIVSVWAAAWGVRVILQIIRGSTNETL